MSYRDYINRILPPLERSCTSKARFGSRREALRQRRRGRWTNDILRPYRCCSCSGWHLGHARQRH